MIGLLLNNALTLINIICDFKKQLIGEINYMSCDL